MNVLHLESAHTALFLRLNYWVPACDVFTWPVSIWISNAVSRTEHVKRSEGRRFPHSEEGRRLFRRTWLCVDVFLDQISSRKDAPLWRRFTIVLGLWLRLKLRCIRPVRIQNPPFRISSTRSVFCCLHTIIEFFVHFCTTKTCRKTSICMLFTYPFLSWVTANICSAAGVPGVLATLFLSTPLLHRTTPMQHVVFPQSSGENQYVCCSASSVTLILRGRKRVSWAWDLRKRRILAGSIIQWLTSFVERLLVV